MNSNWLLFWILWYGGPLLCSTNCLLSIRQQQHQHDNGDDDDDDDCDLMPTHIIANGLQAFTCSLYIWYVVGIGMYWWRCLEKRVCRNVNTLMVMHVLGWLMYNTYRCTHISQRDNIYSLNNQSLFILLIVVFFRLTWYTSLHLIQYR